MDITKKEGVIGEEGVISLIYAIKDSIELIPIDDIWKKYPELIEFESKGLKGHTIEFLLVILRWLGLQEDVNYWGVKFKTDEESGKVIFNKNGERYEGREKTFHAIEDLFINKMPLKNIIRKHML